MEANKREPLAKVRYLNEAINMVLKRVQYLDNKEEIEKGLLEVARKTEIAELVSGKYLIAVTGLQGHGESTLNKSFLELDGDYIPTNAGRGEVEPLIIKVQEGINEPECYKYGYQESSNQFCYEKINKEELKELLEDGIENDDAFYLEVRIPKKNGLQANKEFLLLPGLEIGNEEEEWQQNIEYYLEWCMSAIVISRHETLADSRTELFKKMLDQKIKDNYMVAISFCENKSENELMGIKSNIGKILFNNPDSNKVICTGVKEDKLICGRDDFLAALSSIKVAPKEWRERNIKELRKVIDRKLNNVFRKIKDSQFDSINEGKYGPAAEIKIAQMENFNKGAEDLTKSFKNAIQQSIEKRKAEFLLSEKNKTTYDEFVDLWDDFELVSLGVNTRKLEEKILGYFAEEWRNETIIQILKAISEKVLEKEKNSVPVDIVDMEAKDIKKEHFIAYPAIFLSLYAEKLPRASNSDRTREDIGNTSKDSYLFDSLISKGLGGLSAKFPALKAVEFASEVASIIKYPSDRKKNLYRILDSYCENIEYRYVDWFGSEVIAKAQEMLEKWLDSEYGFDEKIEFSHQLSVALSRLESVKVKICEDLIGE